MCWLLFVNVGKLSGICFFSLYVVIMRDVVVSVFLKRPSVLRACVSPGVLAAAQIVCCPHIVLGGNP